MSKLKLGDQVEAKEKWGKVWKGTLAKVTKTHISILHRFADMDITIDLPREAVELWKLEN